jgi:Domain of unknown function (DUF4386)
MQRIREASPRLKARIAGVFYLLIFVIGSFVEIFGRGRLVVDGDAAATAANILAHQSLYRLGGAAALITLTCDIAVALLFYDLLKPVNRSVSLFAAGFRLVFVPRKLSAPVCSFAGRPLGRVADPLVAGDRLKRSAMEGAGRGYKRGRVYTKHKVVMYDTGHKTVFSGGPICVLYRRDPPFPLFNCQLVNRAECFAHLAKNKIVNSRRMIG